MSLSLHSIQLRDIDLHQVTNSNPASLASSSSRTEVILPPVAKCQHLERIIIFICDESGSVTAHNDPEKPISNRHREMNLVLDHVGTCRCGNELVALRFLDPGSHDCGPVPLTRRGKAEIQDAIDNRPAYTGSTLDSALDEAEAIAVRHPDHEIILVVLSDFIIFDPDPGATLDRFCNFAGERHAVVLRAPVPDRLTDDGGVIVTRVQWDSKPGDVARAVLPALASGRNG